MNNIDIQAVLVEVGRLHLYTMALERQLAEAREQIAKLTPAPPRRQRHNFEGEA